jgi:hypothetical protein
MRVPILSEPVIRHRLHRGKLAARKRTSGINMSQEFQEGFPVDEGDIAMEEDLELPMELMDDESESFSEMQAEDDENDRFSEVFEEDGVELV